MRPQFRTTVTELAAQDESIIVVLGDVSVYMFKDFWDRYPKRFYNMGICENTLISVTAGLSSQGYHPFVHTICPFLTERSIEQIKIDMCYNNFAGNIVTCGATFDYAWDGATHHAYTELAVLRMLPNMEVLHLGSKREVDALIRTQYNNSRPTYFRLSDHPHAIETNLEFGKGTLLKNEGAPVTVMTAGPILGNVMEACRDLPVNLVYFHTLKPIDKALIERSGTPKSWSCTTPMGCTKRSPKCRPCECTITACRTRSAAGTARCTTSASGSGWIPPAFAPRRRHCSRVIRPRSGRLARTGSER